VVIPLLLPVKAERDIFNDSFVTGEDSSAYTVSKYLHKQHTSNSSISIFLHKLVQKINPTFGGIKVHNNFRF
jgi:hypothetical protein